MTDIVRTLFPAGTRILVMLEGLLILTAFVAAEFLLLTVDPTVYLLYEGGLLQVLVVVLTILVTMRLTKKGAAPSWIGLVQQICLVLGIAFLVQGLIAYAFPRLRVPIRVMMLGSPLAGAAIFGLRLVVGALRIGEQ